MCIMVYTCMRSTVLPISGKEMLKRYKKAGWIVLRQKGSHVQVQKGSAHQTIPLHKELRKGAEKDLLKKLEEVG